MNDLARELAPISAEAWSAIEAEAKRTLATYLAGRKLVDFDGPKGWPFSAVSTGRARRLDPAPWDGVGASMRMVQPLLELEAPFALDREEIDAIARGAQNPELGPLIAAARRIALAEDRLVFDGYAAGGVTGLAKGAPHRVAAAGGDDILRAVSDGLETLREAGVGGPGGVVLSQRGGDFELVVGRDVSIGYLSHDATEVRLYGGRGPAANRHPHRLKSRRCARRPSSFS
jgi:uncharacterized linocin/CFP29 family protein